MKRRLINTSIVAAISVVLLYYNVAWAVLRCPHQENHPDLEVVSYDAGLHAAEISDSGPSRHQVNLDCTGPNFHTEMLGQASTASEFPSLTRDVDSRVNGLLAWSDAHDPGQEIWRRASLVENSSSGFHLPQYLSLSVLRL